MATSIPFGSSATADQVIAGIDLTGKHFVVTGCSSGLGLATMNALAANGGHVIGLASTLEAAQQACRLAGPDTTPLACDLADLTSISQAAASIRALRIPLDGIVANAGLANLPALRTRYGVEMQFLVNHVGHFALLNDLTEQVREASGRIVVVSSSASLNRATPEGIMFDNLDGRRFYQPALFYAQSKLANALFAKELSRRLAVRGIAVNSVHPGAARGTRLLKNTPWVRRAMRLAAGGFMKSPAQAAATQTLLMANPGVAGISGEYWANCQIAVGNPLLQERALAERLWTVTREIVTRHAIQPSSEMRRAA